jgi:hypothetical protein
MKITIKKVIEDGMITHLFEGDVAKTKGRGKDRRIEASCELFFRFEDEDGNEWAIEEGEQGHSFYISKK